MSCGKLSEQGNLNNMNGKEGGSMTKEQIDLLKRLQPFFKEKMGKWQFNDNGITIYREGWINFTVFMELDDDTLCVVTKEYGRINFVPSDENLLRIPEPIDRYNSERGMWDMIGGFKDLSSDSKGESWIKLYNQKVNRGDPFTALLKALCIQEGV